MTLAYEPGVLARACLERALMCGPGTTERHRPPEERFSVESFRPTWPSSVSGIDRKLGGGFRGVTTCAAPGKLGKSTLAIGSAIEAAATLEWQVKYFNAELPAGDFDSRISRYVEGRPQCEDALELLHVYHVGRGISSEELNLYCQEEPSALPILCVLDSINTIAQLSRMGYLEALSQIGLWAMMARRQSEGAVSFLIVSETNARGGVKGEQLQFWSDVIVRMSGKPEDGWVEFDIPYSRNTESGQIGRYLRHTPSGRFLQHFELPKPQVVGGREWDD